MCKLLTVRPQDSDTSFVNGLDKLFQYRQQWEQPLRDAAARKLWEKESEISIWAVDTHCELHPEINSPRGSLRRKKGYEDGRHIIRAIANCVKSGDLHPLCEEILSWFAIGDPAHRVTAQDIEFFISFVHQSCRRSLGAKDASIVDELMETAKAHCRQAGACWSLKTNAHALAEATQSILGSLKPHVGDSSQRWIRMEDIFDYERFFIALAETVSHQPHHSLEQFTDWLLSNILVHVDYPCETWQARLTAMQQAILQVLGVDATRRTEPVFEHLRVHIKRFGPASAVARVASLAAHHVARYYMEVVPVATQSISQRVASLQQGMSQLLQGLARLHAAGMLNNSSSATAKLWNHLYTTQLQLPGNLDPIELVSLLLEQVKQHTDGSDLDAFFTEATHLQTVIKQSRWLSSQAEVPSTVPFCDTSSEAVQNEQQAALWSSLPTAILATALECSLSSRGAQDVADFSRWLFDMVLPRFDTEGKQVQAALKTVSVFVAELSDELQAAVKPYFQAAEQARQLWMKRPALLEATQKRMSAAVAECYKLYPNHPMRRNGEKTNGQRDGIFLMEELLRTVAMGQPGRARLLQFYRDEIAFQAKLPARGLMAYLSELNSALEPWPDIAALLQEAIDATPYYTSAVLIYQNMVRTAEQLTNILLQSAPEVESKVGQGARVALLRYNTILVRSFARQLMHYPQTDRLMDMQLQLSPFHLLKHPAIEKRTSTDLAQVIRSILDDVEARVVSESLCKISVMLKSHG